ncbi:unnamed protein product [Polarella glacialis]|uniref:RNA demethylase ALKBH5 n=1 Tax=Polarella glacialis TaxID=89957 RepID=A0A813G832_POLGL|nr:unnamed protein product [Polarella glacialis]
MWTRQSLTELPTSFLLCSSLLLLVLLPLGFGFRKVKGKAEAKQAKGSMAASTAPRRKKAGRGQQTSTPGAEGEQGASAFSASRAPQSVQSPPEEKPEPLGADGLPSGLSELVDDVAAHLSEEQRRTLLKLRRKLREVAKIESLLAEGAPVEETQRAKAETKPHLLAELSDLLALAGVNEAAGGGDGGFVVVTSGMSQSKLRNEEASQRAAAEATAEKMQAVFLKEAWGLQQQKEKLPQERPPQQKSNTRKSAKARKAGAGAGPGSDDEEAWTEVGAPKKETMTEEEAFARALARAKAASQRQAERVQNTSCVEYQRTRESLKSFRLFDAEGCVKVEELINQVVIDAQRGLFKEKTVDLTPMRNKYFFGFAYTYGAQREHPGARGIEAVWPPSETDPIPLWIRELLIEPLEKRGVVPKGWINSATINDYSPGGCIVSHIDPPHLFDRPIIGVNFFSDCNLVFGTSFSFPKEALQEISCSTPVYVHPCQQGYVSVLKGYSANDITHAIRPCDLPSRRASIILRRVLPTAPVLLAAKGTTMAVKDLPAEYLRPGEDVRASAVFLQRLSAAPSAGPAPAAAPSAFRSGRKAPASMLRDATKRFESGVIYSVLQESSAMSEVLLREILRRLTTSSGLGCASAFRRFAGRSILDFKLQGAEAMELLKPPFDALNPLLGVMVSMAAQSLRTGERLAVLQLIVNAFPDAGCEVKPHRHRCRQICVSVGSTRELEVEGQTLVMTSGDVLFLEGEMHSVPPARSQAGPRASVCLFYGSQAEHARQTISVNANDGWHGDSYWFVHPDDQTGDQPDEYAGVKSR